MKLVEIRIWERSFPDWITGIYEKQVSWEWYLWEHDGQIYVRRLLAKRLWK